MYGIHLVIIVYSYLFFCYTPFKKQFWRIRNATLSCYTHRYRNTGTQILLKLNQKPENSSWTYDRIKEAYGASHSTIAGIAQRFVTEGMEAALGRKEQKTDTEKLQVM